MDNMKMNSIGSMQKIELKFNDTHATKLRNFDNAMLTENTHTQNTRFLGDIATERAAPEKKTELVEATAIFSLPRASWF